MEMPEDRQEAIYGGVVPLLFGNLPKGLFDHYAKLLGPKLDDDPLNWEAFEIGA
jgi:hypothetical protein